MHPISTIAIPNRSRRVSAILGVGVALLITLPAIGGVPTPDEVRAAVAASGHPACQAAIVARETGNQFNADAYNPASGAVTEFQFLPFGGVWDETPDAALGLRPTDVSLAERVRMVDFLIDHGLLYVGWGGC